jgi:prepilin-type N-terminal cleavage/methylation domain-containing protein
MNKISKKIVRNLQAGFTLVELLVVISIIGILAGLLITNLVGVRGRAADSKIKNDLGQLKTALRLYYNDYQQYPDASPDEDGPTMLGCGALGTTACSVGGVFSAGAGTTIYMNKLPTLFSYAVDSSDNESFVLSADLDNVSDSDIENSATKCGQSFSSGDVTYYVCSD